MEVELLTLLTPALHLGEWSVNFTLRPLDPLRKELPETVGWEVEWTVDPNCPIFSILCYLISIRMLYYRALFADNCLNIIMLFPQNERPSFKPV
jgi:hypothetical protein